MLLYAMEARRSMQPELVLTVSDFVAVFNQTISYAYPTVTVVGEISNLRVSKNRWVYFDLKDDYSSVKFFGTVYQLPGPLEDGLMVQVVGTPRLHQQFGFSINVMNMQAVGEGSLRRAAELLEAKLRAEGLFDESRRRSLPYPPQKIGLITSDESAAYADFMKILHERWRGVEVVHIDVQVQGTQAPQQIEQAIEYFNAHDQGIEVLVLTRGGGSADDLAAFSTEQVTRAVAGSRIPTIVAIGHEVDISLAELAADQRASTPSNAAQMLVPERQVVLQAVAADKARMADLVMRRIAHARQDMISQLRQLHDAPLARVRALRAQLELQQQILTALNPTTALRRGYALIRREATVIRSVADLQKGDMVSLQLADGTIDATITSEGVQ